MNRHYQRAECVTFRKTNEEFGGLSNMAGGYPIRLGDLVALSSEALYQAARFPHRADVQASILEQRSPMTAKMKSKPFRNDSRPDWDAVRVKVMRWVLRAKLYSNVRFRDLLLATGERMIVEDSRKDRYWGAVPAGPDLLIGQNVLGRLLMELREQLCAGEHGEFRRLPPPDIDGFLFLGAPAPPVACEWSLAALGRADATLRESLPPPPADRGARAPQEVVHPATTRFLGDSGIDDEYCELVRRLAGLSKTKAAVELCRIAETTPEFSPVTFRQTLQQMAEDEAVSPLSASAARVLRAQGALLNRLAQPSFL